MGLGFRVQGLGFRVDVAKTRSPGTGYTVNPSYPQLWGLYSYTHKFAGRYY